MWGGVHCPEDPRLSLRPPPQALLSHRAREVTVSLRATGLVLKAFPDSGTEGEEREKRSRERAGREGEAGRGGGRVEPQEVGREGARRFPTTTITTVAESYSCWVWGWVPGCPSEAWPGPRVAHVQADVSAA